MKACEVVSLAETLDAIELMVAERILVFYFLVFFS